MKDRVDIYILDTERLKGREDNIVQGIAPYYADKHRRAKVESVKMQELGAGYILSKVLGVTKDEQLSFGEHGKPFLSDKSKEFSLSHAGSYVVLAVSKEPVGVDIESTERLTLSVLKRVLPVSYYDELISMREKETPGCDKAAEEPQSPEEKLRWAKAWTSVEAVLKAIGSGFFLDPREENSFMDGWHIESFPLSDEFMVSCAARFPFTVHQNELT